MRARRVPMALGVLAFALVAGLVSWPQDSALSESAVLEEWVARYDGSASDYDAARAVAVDGAGNVYVTGQSKGSNTSSGYATIKYGPDGSEEWVARYDGPASGYDRAQALAVDGAGNVYVTGASRGSATDEDYATIKYGPGGSRLWVARYDGPDSGIDRAYALAVDGAGNVYITGASFGSSGPSGTWYDYATIKYGPDGSEQWVARYDGPANWYDRAHALALDGAGNLYVTGGSQGDYATIKYGPDGSEQWVARYDGPVSLDDEAYALALDGAGNVYVTGSSCRVRDGYQCTNNDYATIKYGPDGSEEWVARYDGPNSGGDGAHDLALDDAGNVYVTGGSEGSGSQGYDYATIKYGPDGSEQWVARYDGPASLLDFAAALALDGAGNVYITGVCDASSIMMEDGDYATIKYGPDGSEQWVARYEGPGSGWDMASALALDGAGNVYVTGSSEGSGTEDDYATIKYAPAPKPTPTPTLTPTPTPTPTKQPDPGDTDGDGCTDQQENGDDPTRGGQRDYLDFWDYGDMPDPNATPQRDGMIRMGDLVQVLMRYGEDGDPGIDPLSVPPKTGYHTAYDRGDWVGPHPWDVEPPNGTIRVPDIVFVLMQYGHDCAE